MPPRFFVDRPLRADHTGEPFGLPPGAARHVQVLRLQPGAAITLFDGAGGEWAASVVQIGRSDVRVRLEAHVQVDRELPLPITLALGMPANERMDTVIEKATELGAVAVQPLLCERSVLRLAGERALKKVAHWQAVALAASEQSGRTRVLQVAPVRSLAAWLRELSPSDPADERARWVLSLGTAASKKTNPNADTRTNLDDSGAQPWDAPPCAGIVSLSGPEGGLSPSEEAAARAAGFVPVSLGARVLRADTAPLALLAHLAIGATWSR